MGECKCARIVKREEREEKRVPFPERATSYIYDDHSCWVFLPLLFRAIALQQTPFSEEDENHLKCLQAIYRYVNGHIESTQSLTKCRFDSSLCLDCVAYTLYRLLTGLQMTATRFGSHWEEIGFQNNDPATDLRGVGVLGLLFLHYFGT